MKAKLLLKEKTYVQAFLFLLLVGNKIAREEGHPQSKKRPNSYQSIFVACRGAKTKSTRLYEALAKKSKNQEYLFNNSRMKNCGLRSHACWFKKSSWLSMVDGRKESRRKGEIIT